MLSVVVCLYLMDETFCLLVSCLACLVMNAVRMSKFLSEQIFFGSLQDKVAKMRVVARIRLRDADLKRLQVVDMEKFNWLTGELQIGIMPPKQRKLYRREVRMKAAQEAKEALIRQKTEELRRRLDDERWKFDEYRAAELADIERSLNELGIEMTSLEQTLTELGASEQVPRPVPWVSLEEQLRQRKIAQLMELKKKTDAEILRTYGFIVPKSLLT